MPYATMYTTKDGSYLGCDPDGAVLIKEDVVEAVRDHENENNRWHGLGYETSMSVCVFDIQFQPTIVSIPESVEEVEKLLCGGVHKLYSVAGRAHGWKLKPECAQALQETSHRPRPISQ